jgi:hypothetical protein
MKAAFKKIREFLPSQATEDLLDRAIEQEDKGKIHQAIKLYRVVAKLGHYPGVGRVAPRPQKV